MIAVTSGYFSEENKREVMVSEDKRRKSMCILLFKDTEREQLYTQRLTPILNTDSKWENGAIHDSGGGGGGGGTIERA